jgi:hypothetical protein
LAHIPSNHKLNSRFLLFIELICRLQVVNEISLVHHLFALGLIKALGLLQKCLFEISSWKDTILSKFSTAESQVNVDGCFQKFNVDHFFFVSLLSDFIHNSGSGVIAKWLKNFFFEDFEALVT